MTAAAAAPVRLRAGAAVPLRLFLNVRMLIYQATSPT
jgi:hypothetical protein